MQYNNDANENDIVSHINDMVNTDNNSFPIKQKTRMVNMAMRDIWQWIFEAYGGWRYDDTNHTTDYPVADTDLVLNQHDYNLPTEALTIRGVEIKSSTGSWHKLEPITEEIIRQKGGTEKNLTEQSGMPMYYLPDADMLRIYPKANYSQTQSLRISFDRDNVNFLPADTVKKPGFMSRFHHLVAVGAARYWAVFKRLGQTEGLDAIWKQGEKDVKDIYTRRYQEKFPQRISVNDVTKEFC